MTARRCIGKISFACATAALTTAIACATGTSFDRSIGSRRWSDAASALSADTSVLNTENGLFQAAMLYSFPNRPTYDPARARSLFERFLQRYPTSSMEQSATDHLSLLYELQKARDSTIVARQNLQSAIAHLVADTLRLRRSIDSIAVQLRAEQDQTALLRKVATRMESDLQDRESQISALHNELSHLKAIDLQPRIRPPLGDTAIRKPRPK
jgi:hypothetical protein